MTKQISRHTLTSPADKKSVINDTDWETGLPPEPGHYWVQWIYDGKPGLPKLMYCDCHFLPHMASKVIRWSGPLKPPPTKLKVV